MRPSFIDQSRMLLIASERAADPIVAAVLSLGGCLKARPARRAAGASMGRPIMHETRSNSQYLACYLPIHAAIYAKTDGDSCMMCIISMSRCTFRWAGAGDSAPGRARRSVLGHARWTGPE